MPRRIRNERRAPGATPDLVQLVTVRQLRGYCPRCGGLLVPTPWGEDFADAKCVACGYRHYPLASAKLIVSALKKAKQEDAIYYAAIDRFRKHSAETIHKDEPNEPTTESP